MSNAQQQTRRSSYSSSEPIDNMAPPVPTRHRKVCLEPRKYENTGERFCAAGGEYYSPPHTTRMDCIGPVQPPGYHTYRDSSPYPFPYPTHSTPSGYYNTTPTLVSSCHTRTHTHIQTHTPELRDAAWSEVVRSQSVQSNERMPPPQHLPYRGREYGILPPRMPPRTSSSPCRAGVPTYQSTPVSTMPEHYRGEYHGFTAEERSGYYTGYRRASDALNCPPTKTVVASTSKVTDDGASFTSESWDEQHQLFVRASMKKRRAPSTTSFPSKLHKIISNPLHREFIDWLPHGRAWRILKPKMFEKDVIPKFFRSERYASFMRQVNGWGFKRITEGPDLNSYYHELFLRGLPDICLKMQRVTCKAKPTDGAEFGECPDFYKISMFAPLPDPDLQDEETAAATPKTIVTKDSSTKLYKRPSSPSSLSTMSGSAGLHDDMAMTNAMEPLTPVRSVHSPAPNTSPLPFHASLANSPSLGYNSSNVSLSSFGATHEELMWGTGPFSSLHHRAESLGASGGHVTPPSSRQFYQSTRSESQHEDTSGLSAADLCYLTHQNRVLLHQAKGFRNDNEYQGV
jgi:hypothetical protein